MKAKLKKRDNDYWLHNESGETIASSWGVPGKKLSIKNCNEIFSSSVVDVEKLAKESWGDKISSPYHAYIEGFNKAMELNKDKVFTLEDMNNAMDWIMTQYFEFHEQPTTVRREQYLKSLQQPTEIEVEIEMVKTPDAMFQFHDVPYSTPKLDSHGCLILKRVV